MTVRLGGIQKYTKEEKAKFEGTKPLSKSVQDWYHNRFLIKYRKFEQPKEFDLYEAIEGKKIELKNRKIVFGIAASEEEFTQYDFLWCPDGPAFVVHKRVLDKFNELCPSDIQALPMVIKNLDPNGVQFENHDFWLINLLHNVEAIDRNLSTIIVSPNGLEYAKQKILKNDCMDGHLLIRDDFTTGILFQPSLAKHFIKSRGIKFLTDEEAP